MGDANQRIHVAEMCCKYKEHVPYFMNYSAFTGTGDFESNDCALSLHSFLHKHWRIHTWENSTVAIIVAKPLISFKT